jgi:hypothetical protein
VPALLTSIYDAASGEISIFDKIPSRSSFDFLPALHFRQVSYHETRRNPQDSSVAHGPAGFPFIMENVMSKKHKCTTVWDEAYQWAEVNFPQLQAKEYEANTLAKMCKSLVNDWPGIATDKWLFVFSPTSGSPLFEVSEDLPRLLIACAKLGTVTRGGGMLFGADCSKGSSSVIKFVPFAVVKPQEEDEQ